MEWNKTKTIFIVAFLILDIFLGYQFLRSDRSVKNMKSLKTM